MLKCACLALMVAFLSGLTSCQSFCEARIELLGRTENADADAPLPRENDNDETPMENRKEIRGTRSRSQAQRKRISDLSPPDAQPMSPHPEHDPNSPCYSGRRAPGPDHGSKNIPHGPDPHDEQHHAGQDGFPSDDPYNGSTNNDKDHPNRPY